MLTLQFLSFTELESLSSDQRVDKLLEMVKDEKIVLLEGMLPKEEAASLIKRTMETIDDQFKGIELGVLNPEQNKGALNKLKMKLATVLLGDRRGLTIIGPASIVKEIKQDPNKISLYTSISKKSRKLLKERTSSKKK